MHDDERVVARQRETEKKREKRLSDVLDVCLRRTFRADAVETAVVGFARRLSHQTARRGAGRNRGRHLVIGRRGLALQLVRVAVMRQHFLTALHSTAAAATASAAAAAFALHWAAAAQFCGAGRPREASCRLFCLACFCFGFLLSTGGGGGLFLVSLHDAAVDFGANRWLWRRSR